MHQGSWLLINGATGTLGVGATLLALAMGVTRIFGVARNRERLDQLKALAPGRIETLALGDQSIAEWVREKTGGLGVDVFLDCQGLAAGSDSTQDALMGLKKGGRASFIGGVTEKVSLDYLWFQGTSVQILGSLWFTPGDGEEMAEMARAGTLNLGVITPQGFPLEQVNDAIEAAAARPGGFVNVVVRP
ncbi:MAG: zinc-binding dehydrogenase [candidate division NC10 bacterium]|nr:zinc-binding dehydrogenase [candidate division NC10 bacterium]